jgi:hypothetical protein
VTGVQTCALPISQKYSSPNEYSQLIPNSILKNIKTISSTELDEYIAYYRVSLPGKIDSNEKYYLFEGPRQSHYYGYDFGSRESRVTITAHTCKVSENGNTMYCIFFDCKKLLKLPTKVNQQREIIFTENDFTGSYPKYSYISIREGSDYKEPFQLTNENNVQFRIVECSTSSTKTESKSKSNANNNAISLGGGSSKTKKNVSKLKKRKSMKKK